MSSLAPTRKVTIGGVTGIAIAPLLVWSWDGFIRPLYPHFPELTNEVTASLTGILMVLVQYFTRDKDRGIELPGVSVALAALLSLFLLSGCAVFKAETPQQQVFAAKTLYSTALTVAVEYESLPPCPAADPCSDPGIVGKIRAADNAAFATLETAESIVRDETIKSGILKEETANAAFSAAFAFKQLLIELELLGE